MKQRLNRQGFTLVELIVAMAIFSLALAILSLGYIRVMKMYQADLASRRTQQAARAAMEEVAKAVRGADSINQAGTTTDQICIEGGASAGRVVIRRDSGTNSLLKYSNGSSCSDYSPAAEVLIDGNGAVEARVFTGTLINEPGGGVSSLKTTITVTTNAADASDACTPGDQFCATTTYTNVVSLRGAAS